MRRRRFRSADNDEPLRYAARTLIAIRTMGYALEREKLKEKVGTIIIGLYLCKC